MFIQFKKVRYKNLLSVGNQFIEIDLNSHKTTLITGANGQGKCVRGSTEVDIDFKDKETEEKFKKILKER